jgi:hypothetical protein
MCTFIPGKCSVILWFLCQFFLIGHCITWGSLPALFCDGFFRDKVSWTVCPGLAVVILLISASSVTSSWVLQVYAVGAVVTEVWTYDLFFFSEDVLVSLWYCRFLDVITTSCPAVCARWSLYISFQNQARHMLSLGQVSEKSEHWVHAQFFNLKGELMSRVFSFCEASCIAGTLVL